MTESLNQASRFKIVKREPDKEVIEQLNAEVEARIFPYLEHLRQTFASPDGEPLKLPVGGGQYTIDELIEQASLPIDIRNPEVQKFFRTEIASLNLQAKMDAERSESTETPIRDPDAADKRKDTIRKSRFHWVKSIFGILTRRRRTQKSHE